MRAIEIALSLANLLAFLGLALPLPAAPWLRYSALAAPLVAGIQVGVEGPRWQMVPAYALAGLFCLVWLMQTFAPVDLVQSRFAAALGIGLGVLALAVATALPVLLPVFRFPPPSGPYAVGTLTYHWVDAERAETFTGDPNDRRELMVQIWYPAQDDPAAPRAPYLEDGRALAPLARLVGLPGFIFTHLKYIQTNAIQAAAAATAAPSYPVLIFSPGRGGYRQNDTHRFEELVSHGYIVAAIDHPYASSGVVFPDGRMIMIDPRLLPGPVGGLPADRAFFEDAIRYMAGDVTFTLDQLALLNQADPKGILSGRLDLTRAGVYAPSLGGLIGAEACLLDARLRACLAMDVHMPPDVVQAGLQQPLMLISREAKWMQIEGWSQDNIDETQTTMRAVYEKLPGDGYLVLVDGIFHTNFSDAAYLLGPLGARVGLIGPIDGKRADEIVSAYVLAFFDRHLKGLPAPLLDGPPVHYPEVHFETRRMQARLR